jgi:16S rRNA (cytosine967-C5)-methyltransferase
VTPAARLQSAIEILDLILASARDNGAAADTIIAKWFSTRRFAGSKDRRAVRDLVYLAIREFGEMPSTARSAFGRLADYDPELAPLFDGSPYGPAPLADGEVRDQPVPMPAWLGRMIPAVEHAALLERAPLDLRANRLKSTHEELLAVWPEATVIAHTEDGLRFTDSFNVEASEQWRGGLVEVQDAGSQMIVAACGATAGMTVVDLCAGGGGKTLALASAMRGEGRLIAAAMRSRISPRLPDWPMSCSSMRRVRAAALSAATRRRAGGCNQRGSTSSCRCSVTSSILQCRWSNRAGRLSMPFAR